MKASEERNRKKTWMAWLGALLVITLFGGPAWSVSRQNLPIIVQSLGPQFQSAPTPNPFDLESNVTTTVYFTIAIGPTGLNKGSVTLYESDEAGNKGALVGVMKDDGSTSVSGDDVLGDGVYTLKVDLTKAGGIYHYRVFALDTSGKEWGSLRGQVFVVDKPTPAMVTAANAHATAINNQWNILKPPANAFDVAQQKLVTYINGLPNALFASKGKNSVFYGFTDAPFVMVQNTIPNTTPAYNLLDGGSRGAAPPFNPAKHPDFLSAPPALPEGNSLLAMPLGAGTDDANKIKDKKALFIDPYYWQHLATTSMEDTAGGWTKIKAATCPNLVETAIKNGTTADVDPHSTGTDIVDAFTTLSNYGTVLIHTHGDYWEYDSIDLVNVENKINALPETAIKRSWQLWLWNERLSRITSSGQKTIFRTGSFINSPFSAILTHKYWRDITMGRLYLANTGEILVTPAFISAHNGPFPNSVIWAGGCHGPNDTSMADVFLGKGAGAYFGFNGPVARVWNVFRSGDVFAKMLSENKTAKEAFDAAVAGGNNDGSGTSLVIKGNQNLKYEPGLQNPSFEDPRGAGSLQGWTVVGDGRVWHGFQDDSPIQGNTMAVISTGLGQTTEYGSIEQTFCMPAKAQTLKFNWNFYSAEFLEFCDTQFNDTFRVLINGAEVFSTSVNTLCAAGGLIPTGPIDDTTDTFKTGWQTGSVSLVPYTAGTDVTLRFEVQDKGDTVYDTAILVDNLIVEFQP
jgi:hypothetical protein